MISMMIMTIITITRIMTMILMIMITLMILLILNTDSYTTNNNYVGQDANSQLDKARGEEEKAQLNITIFQKLYHCMVL